MKKIYLFLISVFFISSVFAIGVSPSNLVFDLKAGEELCQNVYVTFDTPSASVFDVWGKGEEAEWKFADFKTKSTEHGITITYPKTLSNAQKEVEVCVNGKYNGEYHGALVSRGESGGNVVSQAAVWLLINIEDGLTKPDASDEEEYEVPSTTSLSAETNDQNNAPTPSSPSITGNVVREDSGNWVGTSIWLVVIAVFTFIVLSIYVRMKRRREIWGDYSKPFY